MSNDPFGGDDLPGDPGEDIQKFRELRNRDQSWSIPGILEGVLAACTGLVAVVWFAGLFLLDVEGTTWMGLGALGGLLFGTPAAIVYGLRRGGAEIVRQTIRGLMR